MATRRRKRLSKISMKKDNVGVLIYDYHPKTKVGRKRLVKLLDQEVIDAEIIVSEETGC